MAIPLRDDAPTRRTPWATGALILANVVVFLFIQPAFFQSHSADQEMGTSRNSEARREAETFLYEWGAIPCEVEHGGPLARLSGQRCHGRRSIASDVLPRHKNVLVALVTSIFLHGSIGHLAGNMLFLWVFGNNVEDRLGPLPYLVFYLVGGVAATLGYVVFNSGSVDPVVGASGAIAAVMGAYLVFKPRGRVLTVVTSAAFQVVYVPAFVLLGLFFVTQFFTPSSTHVAWQAHAVGMAFGALVALALARSFPDPFRTQPTDPGRPPVSPIARAG